MRIISRELPNHTSLFKYGLRKQLWDGIISFPFVKDATVFPMLKVLSRDAIKLLSLAFKEFDHGRVILLCVKNFPEQKRLFRGSRKSA